MLTPAEIQSREFLVSLRGYDRDEVHAFLEEVAALVGQLQSGEAAQGAAAEPAAAPPVDTPRDHFADVAAQTQRVLEAAYAAAEEIRSGAERHRDEMVAKAQLEASDVLSELAAQRRAEEAGLAELAQRRQHYRDELATLAGSLHGLVGELDAASPDAAAATRDAPSAQKPAGPAKMAVPANAAKAAAPKASPEPEPAAPPADAPAGDTVELDEDLVEDLAAADATADAQDDEEAQQELLADAEASSEEQQPASTSAPPATGSRSSSSSQARRGRRS